MDADKKETIRTLISIFARDFPRRNHLIVIDMSTGSYRVDEMLTQEIIDLNKDSPIIEASKEFRYINKLGEVSKSRFKISK